MTKVEIRGVVFDEKSSTYNSMLQWDAQNFTGFWYNSVGGKSSETLTINQNASYLNSSNRTIGENNLLYRTSRTSQNYTLFSAKGIKVDGGLEYDSSNKTFTKNATGASYARLGWFGDVYIALNGKASKLTRVVKEQTKSEKKTLTIGETWDLGEGWSLAAYAIDAKTTPRQTHLTLSRNGVKLDDKFITEGKAYIYIQNLNGETDVPVFVTYIDSIFAGATSDFVQLRYTWLISQNVLEIKPGDRFGILEVGDATEDYLLLQNIAAFDLNQNSVFELSNGLKLKAADSSTTLRFYPSVEKTLPGKYEIRGGVYDESKYKNLIWDAQRFTGFWYNLISGKSSETLTINQDASNLTNASRVIDEGNLQYKTSRTSQNYTVFTAKGLKVQNGLVYDSVNKTYTNSINGISYARLGWFGTLYVALNGKANKLTKLVKEQTKSEKQTLTIVETWDLGEGFTLTASSIDAKTSPRQAHLILSKDGRKLDDKILTEGQVYTYIQTLNGETDIPVFVTYVDSIFAGDTRDIVQLRYTWLISQNVLEIKPGDRFGAFEVNESTPDYVTLRNAGAINLGQNSVIDLAGDIKLKVADSSTTLRFYPFVENTIQETSQTGAAAGNSTVVPTTAATTSGVLTGTATAAATPVDSATPNVNQVTVSITSSFTPSPVMPGFEALFAVTGLIAVAYLSLRKKH